MNISRIHISRTQPMGIGRASIGSQEKRFRSWIGARRLIWQGTVDTYMMGDINVDWAKRGVKNCRNVKMLTKLE